jgi:hypothetical protein
VIKRLFAVGFVVSLTFLIAFTRVQAVSAQGPSERVILNDRYVLGSKEVHSGNLTIIARDVEIQAGSRVDGDVSIVSAGSVTLGGEINGDVSILAPSAELESGLRVNGSLSVCAREFQQAPDAMITGSQSTGCNQLGSILSGVGRAQGGFPQAVGDTFFGEDENPIVHLFRVIVTACVVAALAALAATVLPGHVRRMTETAMSRFATTTAIGVVSMAVALTLSAVYLLSMILTLGLTCLILPLVAAAWFVIALALLTGWIAVSVPLGTLLLHRFKVYPTPMVSAALGALVLTLAHGLLEMLPCVGWLAWVVLIVLGSAGFGSVVLTRFGTRPYPEIVPARAYPDIV